MESFRIKPEIYFGDGALSALVRYQDPHFFNMALKAGETKEVHLWFAIPEDVLEDSYLVFNEASDNTQFVKIMQ